jgi:hypothetical protein
MTVDSSKACALLSCVMHIHSLGVAVVCCSVWFWALAAEVCYSVAVQRLCCAILLLMLLFVWEMLIGAVVGVALWKLSRQSGILAHTSRGPQMAVFWLNPSISIVILSTEDYEVNSSQEIRKPTRKWTKSQDGRCLLSNFILSRSGKLYIGLHIQDDSELLLGFPFIVHGNSYNNLESLCILEKRFFAVISFLPWSWVQPFPPKLW